MRPGGRPGVERRRDQKYRGETRRREDERRRGGEEKIEETRRGNEEKVEESQAHRKLRKSTEPPGTDHQSKNSKQIGI